MDKKEGAVVLAENDYEDLELWVPLMRLRENGMDVQVVAPEAGKTYLSKHGYPVQSDAAPGDVVAAEVGLLVVPGGYAPDRMRRHKPMVDLVRHVHDLGGTVAIICHGGWMACSAGILEGRKATSFFAIRDDMENAGAEWVDESVVVDGNLISSRTPDDLPLFCRAILKVIGQRYTTLA